MAQVNPQRHPGPCVIVDEGGFTSADVIRLANYDGIAVAIIDGNGSQITSFGGGTQYTDGDTSATPTGTIALAKNPSNILHALSVDTQGNLNVNLANGTIQGGNAAASTTGAAVPTNADYLGVSVGGNLVGVTGFSFTGAKAVAVAIVDSSGNQITSFGGGTVSVSNFPATQNISGSVSVSNFPATQAVSWTGQSVSVSNFPATQPVSGSVSVSNFPATQVISGTVTAKLNDGSGTSISSTSNALNVYVTNPSSGGGNAAASATGSAVPAQADYVGFSSGGNLVGVSSTNPLPVTVGNFPATQVVSWSGQSVSVSNFPATQVVSWSGQSVTANIGTTNGLALDATLGNVQVASGTTAPSKIDIVGGKTNDVTPQYQPIPLASGGASVIVSISGAPSVSVSNFPATQVVSQSTAANLNATVVGTGTFAVQATQSGTWTVQPGNTANTTAWLVNGPTLTRGTQGSVGFAVQNLKDSGRTYVAITLDAVTGVTTEALATLAINKGGTSSSATSYTVTTGKTLRLQSITAMVRSTSTAALTAARVRLRTASSSISVTSPLLATLDCCPPTATAASGAEGWAECIWPDGLEISSAQQIAISQVISATTSAVSLTLVGYEY